MNTSCPYALYGVNGYDALRLDRQSGRMRSADDSGPETVGGHAWVPRRRVDVIGF